MADIRRVTGGFAVAPQLEPEDFADLVRLGFRHVVNNRPDGEAPGQLASAHAESMAKAAGLTYVHAPFAGQPPATAIDALQHQLASATGPVLAYCRSGTRSITAWAILQAQSGTDVDTLLQSVRTAGYNLDAMKEFLRNLQTGY